MSGWYMFCHSSLLFTLAWKTRASLFSVLSWSPSNPSGSSETWNHPAFGWRGALLSHWGSLLNLGCRIPDAEAVSGLSTAPHPCPRIPSLLRPLPHSGIWRKVSWMALQADASCALTRSFHSSRRRLMSFFAELESFTEGSCSRQQLNCRCFGKAAVPRRADESSRREAIP